MSADNLRRELEQLDQFRGPFDSITAQQRGHDFEQWLKKLLRHHENLHPRLTFRPKGEEIDGSLICDSRIFLLEAKWWNKPLSASSIYSFKAKVDGKLAGTVGLFISMSGYTEPVVDALRIGKELNVILFDQGDLDAAIDDGFKPVLRVKLRAAAELGEVKYPYLVNADRKAKDRVTVLTGDSLDEEVLRRILRRVRDRTRLRQYEIRSAGSEDAIHDTLGSLLEATAGDVVALVREVGSAVLSASASAAAEDRLTKIDLDLGVRDWFVEAFPSDRGRDLLAMADTVDLADFTGLASFEKLMRALRSD